VVTVLASHSHHWFKQASTHTHPIMQMSASGGGSGTKSVPGPAVPVVVPDAPDWIDNFSEKAKHDPAWGLGMLYQTSFLWFERVESRLDALDDATLRMKRSGLPVGSGGLRCTPRSFPGVARAVRTFKKMARMIVPHGGASERRIPIRHPSPSLPPIPPKALPCGSLCRQVDSLSGDLEKSASRSKDVLEVVGSLVEATYKVSPGVMASIHLKAFLAYGNAATPEEVCSAGWLRARST
jgi:hypothetical protein